MCVEVFVRSLSGLRLITVVLLVPLLERCMVCSLNVFAESVIICDLFLCKCAAWSRGNIVAGSVVLCTVFLCECTVWNQESIVAGSVICCVLPSS